MRFRQSPTDPDFVQNPYPAYDAMRAAGPAVFWEDYDMWVLPGCADVAAAFRDRRLGREVTHVASREALGWDPIPDRLAPFYAFEAHSLLEREPPAHTRLRRLVNRAFTSRAIAGLEPRIAALANALIDGFAGETDLIDAYAGPIPLTIIAELLGAPVEESERMLAWSHDMVAMYQANRDRAIEDRAVAATEAFTTFMAEVIARRRRAPGDALIDDLIAAEEGGETLSEPELLTACILLMNAGHEATVHAIGNGVKAVIEAGADRTAFAGPDAETATEEVLRFDPPLHKFTRFALEDVEIAGVRLRLGDEIGLLLGAAGRDPAQFADPARLDLRRANAGRHLSLGAGIHFCVGAPLARLETRVALRELFRRAPDISLAENPRYADRYHFHGLEALRVR